MAFYPGTGLNILHLASISQTAVKFFFVLFYLFPSAFSHVFWQLCDGQNTCETLQEIISSNRLQQLEKLSVRCFLFCFFLRENEQWHVHTLKAEAGTLILFPEVKTESRSKRRELQQCDWHGQMSAPWYIFFCRGDKNLMKWWASSTNITLFSSWKEAADSSFKVCCEEEPRLTSDAIILTDVLQSFTPSTWGLWASQSLYFSVQHLNWPPTTF